MNARVDVLAVAVADIAVELQRVIANRSQARGARRIEIARYFEERDEEGGRYPLTNGHDVDDTDVGCESALAACKEAQAVVTATRGKLRSATTQYARARGLAAPAHVVAEELADFERVLEKALDAARAHRWPA